MVMACFTINCALILLNRWSVVVHETRRSELNPFSSQSEIQTQEHKDLIMQSNSQQIKKQLLFITCQRVLIFQYVLNQIVHQLNTGLLCWFVGSLLFRLQQLNSLYTKFRDAQQNKHTKA